MNKTSNSKIWDVYPNIVHYVGEDKDGYKKSLCNTGNPRPKYAKSLGTATCRSCIKRSKR